MNVVQIIGLLLFAHQFLWDDEHFLKNEICGILMSPHSSLHPWTFPKLLNALLQNLQRSTFFSVYFALDLWLYSQILLRHFPYGESFRFCLFLVIQFLRFPRSIMNYLSVPYGLRISFEKRFFMMRENLLHRIPRSFLRFPWSIVRRSTTFPVLRRPRTIIFLFWLTCWWRSTRFPWSIVYRNRFPRMLISMPGSNSQSRATLWVLETCLIVGLLPLMIILITASLSSNKHNKASWRADWTFGGTESMSFITLIFLWSSWRLWTSLSSCPDPSETRETFQRTETIRSHNSRASKPSIQSQSSVQRDDFRFSWTVRNSSLFLAHPTYWNKSMTSKNA